MSDGITRLIYIAAESAFNTAPTSTAYQTYKVTGGGLKLDKTGEKTTNIESDGVARWYDDLSESVSGSYTFAHEYATHDDLLAWAFSNTWATDTPSVGIDRLLPGATNQTFTVIEYLSDSSGDQWYIYSGVEIGGGSISMSAEGRVELTLNMLGASQTISATAPTGISLTAAPVPDNFTAARTTYSTGTGSATGSVSLSSNNKVTSFTVNFEFNKSLQMTCGSLTPVRKADKGNVDISGEFTILYETSADYTPYSAGTLFAIQADQLDAAGNKQTILLPHLRHTDGSKDFSPNSPITATFPFEAMYNSNYTSNIVIDRDPV